MQYRSTRDQAAKQMTAPEAILQGLAPDGGLFVPQSFPQPDYDLGALVNAPYQEVTTTIWGWFFDDFSLAVSGTPLSVPKFVDNLTGQAATVAKRQEAVAEESQSKTSPRFMVRS
ncbi:MAG: hypothetical protein ACFNOE_07185, partial [Limosilactobacillus fermentum]